MHILLTNDDGPPDNQACPYMKFFVDEIHRATDWKLSIVIPDQQRSWIGKAHFAGKIISTTYIYTQGSTDEPNDAVNNFLGPFNQRRNDLRKTHQEWHLVDSTPAACADIGIHHLSSHDEPVDIVISGPNFGKNAGNLYILASGTVGAAMEAVTHGVKSIALSYEFRTAETNFLQLREAAKLSVKLVELLYEKLKQDDEIELFSINVPLTPSIKCGTTKVKYAPILNNTWKSIYEPLGDGQFSWSPDFKKVWKEGLESQVYSDNRVLLEDAVSVTPLKACFKVTSPLSGEIEVGKPPLLSKRNIFLMTIDRNNYLYDIWKKAFHEKNLEICFTKEVLNGIKSDPSVLVFHYGEYEDLDIDLLQTHPTQYFVSSYIYRKALIRKHYLANTVHQYIVKNRGSSLAHALPATYLLEVDYAEFLDDALDEAYELRQEIERGDRIWILKPSMADKGQGIRLFKSLDDLQSIFNSFDESYEENTDNEQDGIIVSQLRHFVVQEYEDNPLLLQVYNKRKFHLRVYVVALGNINVYLYENFLALFAAKSYARFSEMNEVDDLSAHLTNTCLQEGKHPLVLSFWDLLELKEAEKKLIFESVKGIVRDLFTAAISVDKINFQPLPNGIEFYGLDFLVLSDLSVKLLEVNAYPDFKQTGDDLKEVISTLIVSTASVIANKFFNLSCDNKEIFSLHRLI